MSIRLRQVALVGNEYEKTEKLLKDILGLSVAYRDPGNRPGIEAGVSIFGLRNFVMPIGNQFLELVAPIDDEIDTSAGRYIDRRSGPGGYMLLFQVPKSDFNDYRNRLTSLGIREIAGESITGSESEAVHLHPKDFPGCITEFRWCINEENEDGDWWPVERNWRENRNTEVVSSIAGAEIQTTDPLALSGLWSQVLNVPKRGNGAEHSLTLSSGVTIRFVEPTDGRPEGLSAIDLIVKNPQNVLEVATLHNCETESDNFVISGLRFNVQAD
ncbi:MAG: hypothetical protein ACJ05G_07705 [Actinomycetota bacterium]|nr:VOC family protein [Acidimicrobiales bacterium]